MTENQNDKPTVNTAAQIRAARLIFASAGGRAIAKKIGKEGYSKMGKKGAAKRWKGHKKAV